MELLIKTNNKDLEQIQVVLKRGHLPTIVDHRPSSTTTPRSQQTDCSDCIPLDIEPAIWFKVTVVDTVYIDCTKHEIRWKTDGALTKSNGGEMRRSCCRSIRQSSHYGRYYNNCQSKSADKTLQTLFAESECIAETNLDDMFYEIELSIAQLTCLKINRNKFNCEIMRILHCHVLPVISFTTYDILKLKLAQADGEKYIQSINENILHKDCQMYQIQEAMKRQRNSFLSSSDKIYSKELAQLLLKDYQIELEAQSNNHVASQNTTDERSARQQDRTEVDTSNMQTVASSLDHVHLRNQPAIESKPKTSIDKAISTNQQTMEQQQKLKTAIANLAMLLSDKEAETKKTRSQGLFSVKLFSKPQESQSLVPLHAVYLGMERTLMEVKKKITDLIEEKVRLLTVAHALKTTLEELEVDEVSHGIDIDMIHGTRSTDIHHDSKIPREWMSIAGQVSDLVHQPKSEINLCHYKACNSIIDECQVLTNRERWSAYLPSTKWYVPRDWACALQGVQSGSNRLDTNHSNFVSEQNSFLSNDDEEDANEMLIHNQLTCTINSLKFQIQDHFQRICTMIQTSLGNDTHQFMMKVWLWYEYHFYGLTRNPLLALYNKALKTDITRLENFAAQLTVDDLGLQESSVTSMLEPKSVETSDSRVEVITVAAKEKCNVQTTLTQTGLISSISDNRCLLPNTTVEAPVGVQGTGSCQLASTVPMMCQSLTTSQSSKLDEKVQIVSPKEKGTEELRPGSLVCHSTKLKEEFKAKFSLPKDCLKEALQGTTPLKKLQSLKLCVQELSSYETSSDDILDMLLILLLNMDGTEMSSLYPQIMFLTDTCPKFFDCGAYSYCLVQFSITYHILQQTIRTCYDKK